jgi:nitroreductase
MILAGWDLGIGSCPATVYEHEVVRDILGFPNDQHCEYILSFGYPADESVLTAPKEVGGRLARADVLHEETW